MFSALEVKHISGISGRVFWPHLEGGMEGLSPREACGASFSTCRDCRRGCLQWRAAVIVKPGFGAVLATSLSPLLKLLPYPNPALACLPPSQLFTGAS